MPHKLVVAKRLSQCLNPALPTGVHARALDVYTHIFTVLGVDGLRRDLPVWTPGLLPFFAHAATSVRPVVLDMYERFYIPLSDDLRPVTRALLLSLLPGLEEESGEYFDRVVALLDRISASVTIPFFLQCIWIVLATSPAVRLSALNYLARRMPPLSDANAPCSMIEANLPLFVRGFVHVLNDEALLVRRQGLDFLVVHVPLASPVFAALDEHAHVAVMNAALSAVLRRDISLNRRLYAWLLGSGESDEDQQAYFEKYALPVVARALCDTMNAERLGSAAVQRPYKIFVSLMDKRTLAQPLLRVIILDVFAALTRDLERHNDLNATAQTLFEAADDFLLYGALYSAMRGKPRAWSRAMNAAQTVGLFRAVLALFPHHKESATVVHLPALFAAQVALATDSVSSDTLSLLNEMAEVLAPRAFEQQPNGCGRDLYAPADALYSGAQDPKPVAALQDRTLATVILERVLRMALSSDALASCPHRASQLYTLLERLSILVDEAHRLTLAAKGDHSHASLDASLHLDAWNKAYFARICTTSSYKELAPLLRAGMRLSSSAAVHGSLAFATPSNADAVLAQILTLLQSDTYKQHDIAVALYWDVQACVPTAYATRALCAQLSQGDARAMVALGSLWRLRDAAPSGQLDTPLLIVLDGLRSTDMTQRHAAEVWLSTHVSDYAPLLHMVLRRLLNISAERTCTATEPRTYVYEAPFDQAYTDYYLATLSALVVAGGTALVDTAASIRWGEDTALDVLREHVVLLLRSAPRAGPGTLDMTTYAHSLHLLHLLLVTGAPDTFRSATEAALLDVLRIALARRDGSTQIMALRTLRDVVGDALSDDVAAAYADIVRRGLTTSPGDCELFAWTAFVHTLLPRVSDAVNEFMLPLCATLRELLVAALRPMSSHNADIFGPTLTLAVDRTPSTEREIVQLLSVLEHTLLQALSSRHLIEPDSLRADASAPSGSFLASFSSVFVAEATATPPSNATPLPVARTAAQVVQLLQYVWIVTSDVSLPTALGHTTAALERLYRVHTAATLDALAEAWWLSGAVNALAAPTPSLLTRLAGSEQVVCAALCDSISSRRRNGSRGVLVNDLLLLRFLDAYAQTLSSDALAQVWPVVALLAKGVQTGAGRAHVFLTLRLVTTMGVRLAPTRVFEDARARRDVQDTFVRLGEQVLSLYARSLDVTSVARDSDSASVASEREDIANDAAAPTPVQVVQFFAASALPALQSLAIETDRAMSLCTSLAYYVLAPGFKSRARAMDIEPLVLDLLTQMSTLTGTSKTWRAVVWDTFLDAKFFALSPAMGKRWAPIVAALMSAERDRLVDVIGRMAPAPSTNLFTSREADVIARVVGVRRLAYTVWTAQPHTFLAQLPLIQEKVVDILRAQSAELVQAEVYLCMRVLLCRFSSQHLAGFWPILLTELMRIFGKARTELPEPRTDALHLLFSVSKLVDLLITLQTEDFQIHQWLLITDTPDAVQVAEQPGVESLLDCIARVAGPSPAPSTDVIKQAQQRRPMLPMSRIETVTELTPFFANASRAFYESQFLDEPLDVDQMEEGLLHDLFEPIAVQT